MTSPARPLCALAAAIALLASGCGGGGSSGGVTGTSLDGGTGGDAGATDAGGTDGGGTDGGPGADGGSDGGTAAGPQDWPQYRHDVSGSSAGEALATGDAAALRELWSRDVGAYGYSQPVRAGDAVYVATSTGGKVFALDARDGAVRWTRDLGAAVHSDCAGASGEWRGGDNRPGIWGAPGVEGGLVLVGAPDGAVQALDAASGATRFAAPVASPSPHAELVESSVAIGGGRAWVGVGAVAHCDPARGRVAAVDLGTGAVATQAFVDPGQLGAAVWSTPSLDEADGTVFVATGNALGPAASSPLAQAVVALDAVTLTPRAHWQNPAGGLENCDFGASPTLFEAGGRKLLAVASKDGWLYVLDRARLGDGPVWRRQLASSDPADPAHCGDPLQGFGAISSPSFAAGVLYAAGGRTPAGEPGAVVALDAATGALRWSHATPGFVLGPVAVAGPTLAVASTRADGTSALELLDAATGAALRTFDGATPAFAGPIVSRGQVLWVTFGGRLAALGR